LPNRAPTDAQITGRENEIVQWVMKGLTNAEIAKQLFLSEITVKKHLSSVYGKLGVTGRAQLIKRVMSGDRTLKG
jgi:DNA-binding CsgD family transcriptional regulator